MLSLAVTCTTIELQNKARELAKKLHLPFLIHTQNEELSKYDYLLTYTETFLELRKSNSIFFHIDFLSGKIKYRSKQAGLRKELLARAIGFHPRENPNIIDATAGLGLDSFILASLGFEITLLERSPIMHALLSDALYRAKTCIQVAPIIKRMHLINADAREWLQNKSCDIILLDPMFPERKKSSLVKKEMVIMQDLLGKDEDSNSLFQLALTCATHRVVVKRPRLAANIADFAPNFSHIGKSNRFDVYLTHLLTRQNS